MELQDVLSLTAKLQAAEARALAAEMRLKRISDAINDDVTSFTDALSIAEGVIADSDLTAAREMMRKAGEADKLRTQLTTVSKALEAMTPGGSEFIDDPMRCIEQIKRQIEFCKGLYRVKEEKQSAALAALRTESDELAALVEQQRKAIQRNRQGLVNILKFYKMANGRYGNLTREDLEEEIAALDALALTPPAALAALRQRVRVEVLEEVATLANEKAVSLMRDSAKAHEDNCPIMGRARLAEARLFDFFAAKIRAMKEAQ